MHSLKQIVLQSKDQDLRLEVVSGLFTLFSASEDRQLAATIFKMLTFFLVEWHELSDLRAMIVREMTLTAADATSDADFNELAVPLCNIIKINAQDNSYLT